MTEITCIRCGDRPAVPGKLGQRCPDCIGEIARERGVEV